VADWWRHWLGAILTQLQRIQTDDGVLSQLQDNVQKALAPAGLSPFIGGTLLEGISLVSGSNTIPHTLKRTPTIWVLCDINSADTVYRTAWDRTNIYLTASGTVTVSIWVY
jgi:hypothetical protein